MAFEPVVSIVLPTYNRADVIGRAIDSVRAQSFPDWELLVVDDGSTDGTAEVVAGIDERVRLLRQPNGGTYVARNHGLAQARGRYLTFLDSDDAWLPHFLELCVGFLRAHADAQFVTTEFFEDLGNGIPILHDAHEIGTQYPEKARAIGSRLLDLPAGATDDYLRVYAASEPIGDWGAAAAERAGVRAAKVYRGSIFEHMRFGYLNWLPITMLTRVALEAVGPFTTHTRSAADYRFLCRLARAFPAHMIGVPSATKYDRAAGAQTLKQGHLAKGPASYRFEMNKLGFFDEMFTDTHGGDPEIARLRCHYLLDAGEAALRSGQRADAMKHLREAARWEPRLWKAYGAWALCRALPSDRWAGAGYRFTERVRDLGERVVRGELGPAEIWKRLSR
jgi:glycosyltransferase involved in cell wall biosynthesis